MTRQFVNLTFKQSDEFRFHAKIEVFHGPYCIGIAKVSRNGSTATLADIIIYKHKRRFINCLPIYKIVDYRNKGIGTELLMHVISFCTQNGIQEIHGRVNGDTKILIPWYIKHGFNVNKHNELHMDLNS